MTTKMNRFLALVPAVAFAAACNGVAPTGPSQITSNDSYDAVSGQASTMTSSCVNLGRISLNVVEPAGAILWVQATYHFTGPSIGCPAPRWTSNRVEMVLDKTNPMRAGFPRAAGGTATLTATAPNQVTKSIVVDLGGTRADQSCKQIAGVSVKIVPVTVSNDVSVKATYRYTGPVIGTCAQGPAWTASRRGLNVDPNDPFRAFISRRTDIRTTVTATAPNGRSGKVTF
jgi:hypothetical protein